MLGYQTIEQQRLPVTDGEGRIEIVRHKKTEIRDSGEFPETIPAFSEI